MKKLLFIAIVALLSLASCTKDRTCTCTTTTTRVGGVTKIEVTDYPKSKKGSAKHACAISSTPEGKDPIYTKTTHTEAVIVNGTVVSAAYTETETCELK